MNGESMADKKTDYSTIRKLVYKDTDYTIDSEVMLNLGRLFESPSDNFFGVSTIKTTDVIDKHRVLMVATNKRNGVVDILFDNSLMLTLKTNTKPLLGDNVFLKNKLWESPGVIAKKASRQEVQDGPEYALKSMRSLEMMEKDVVALYEATDDDDTLLREFIMTRVGDLELSEAESTGKRVFPKGIDEEWLRNRFIQTSSFLTEVFAFPDEITKDVFLSAFLVKGGSCLLSGVPGTGKSIAGNEMVFIKNGEGIKEMKIGEYVNSIFDTEASEKTDIAILNDDTEVLSLDHDNNKIRWMKLTGVSRHGFKGSLVKIRTLCGREISATPDHSFVIISGKELITKKGSNLNIGDIVPTSACRSSTIKKHLECDEVYDEIVGIVQVPYDGSVYDLEVGSSPTNTFVANGIVVHNTVLADLATLLFMNAYGFSNFDYRAPVQNMITGKTPTFIYKDLNSSGISDKANILTVPPDKKQLNEDGRDWCILRNIPTTNETVIRAETPNDVNIKAFLSKHDIQKKGREYAEIADVLNTGKVSIGHYGGHILSQRYSINRVGEYLTDWNEDRFDGYLLIEEGGILKNRYYSKSLLREGKMGEGLNPETDKMEEIPSIYVSDVTYDMAKYPDTGKLVRWKEEVEQELEFLKNEEKMLRLRKDARLGKITDPDDKIKAEQAADMIDAIKCNIHLMHDLDKRSDWEKAYRAGRSGKLAEKELRDINVKYGELYDDLKYLTHSILNTKENIQVFNARSNDEILEEMKSDMGLTTCSENKTPEEILYTTEISLVQDTDAVGRPIQQYVFKPAPLDFVWKPGKFLNEFTRADKDFQDQLLSLLDRRLVEHRGQHFKSPAFVLFADNNPHKLLTAQIDWALWDRIDVELFLKGAKLGTKDMILTRKFGREDIRTGKTRIKMNFEEELLERVNKASIYLNDFKRSAMFRDKGVIDKPSGDAVQGIIPMRFREIQKIWEHIEKISIPKRVLHTVYLLTTTMNQAWYLKRTKVNEPNKQAKIIQFPGTEMIPESFEPYGTLKPREAVLDYSVLEFASDFMEYSSEVSNLELDNAKDQFPLGVTRPVGIRFVISLLKFAKALAWLRRGRTEVTPQEIYDLFPLVGSHRLNIMPFGEERIAGIDESIKRLYPNIQDFLRYGILDTFWKPRAEQYLNYYEDLESVIDAGYLNVDGCPPSEISKKSSTLCKIKGSYDTHSALPTSEERDVVILDIQNGVEFVKRYSPEYRKHYNRRVENIRNIASKNYYNRFLEDAKNFINRNDLNEDPNKKGEYNVPMLLFPIDAKDLGGMLNNLARIFDENYHRILLNNVETKPETLNDVAIPVLEAYRAYITNIGGQYGTAADLGDTIENLKGIYLIYSLAQTVEAIGEIAPLAQRIKDIFDTILTKRKSVEEIEKMGKDEVMGIINDHLKSIVIDEKYRLTPSGYRVGKDDLSGELVIVFKPDANERYVMMKATTLNEHLLWRYIRFTDPLEDRPPLTERDRLN